MCLWRMNGLRKMAVVLVLCALLLNNGVMCQDDVDATITPDDATAADQDATVSQAPVDSDDTTGAPDDVTAAALPGDVTVGGTGTLDATPLTDLLSMLNLGDAGLPRGDGGGQALPGLAVATVHAVMVPTGTPAAASAALDDPVTGRLVVPLVRCVEKEAMSEPHIKTVLSTTDCEETKRLIEANPATWCPLETCRLDISQQGNEVMVASPDAPFNTLAKALQSETIKGVLGVSEVTTPSSSSGSSVFVAVLLTGLLLAAALLGGFCLRKRRATNDKGIRLAEETYPVDVENQGNTLESVAPLNPPPETQEKPSVNGDSPEEDKTQSPPSNGHSTTKTTDTEL